MTTTTDTGESGGGGVLSPIDRLTELLYGIILVLTFTGTLRVAARAGDDAAPTLWGGCGAAWPGVLGSASPPRVSWKPHAMKRGQALPGFVLVMLLLICTPEARAQAVEVGAFTGLGFGGVLVTTPGHEHVPLQAGGLYGGALSVEFLPRWRVEALVMRQESKVRGPADSAYVGVDVDRYMVSVLSHEPLSRRVDIVGAFLLGATRFKPAGYESELWFTLGVAAGVKTYATKHIGFRLEARGYYTLESIGGAVICGGYGCAIGYTGTGAFQGDVTAGVIVGF